MSIETLDYMCTLKMAQSTVRRLDEVAARTERSRSGVIRHAVNRLLQEEADRESGMASL
jgi:predicted transcriptional regulator